MVECGTDDPGHGCNGLKALSPSILGYIRISQRAQIPYISIFYGLNGVFGLTIVTSY